MRELTVEGGADAKKKVRRWYTNVYVMLIVLVSVLAVSMAALMLLLLPQSSEIVRIMQWRMVNAKSAYVESVIEYKGDRQWKDAKGATRHRDEALSLESSGWFDRLDPELPKSKLTFDLKTGQGDAWRFAGDFVRAGEANYFNFTSLPERIGTLHFSEFMHRWLRVDVKGLLEVTSLPIIGGERPELTELDQAYLIEQFRKTPFVRVEEKLKAEELGGVRTHHYKVRPEVLFFKDYYVVAESTRLGRELTNKERLAADAFFANVTAEDGELWIGVRDYYLYRMRLRFKYDDGARTGHFTVTANFSRFNEPSVMSVPVQGVDDITDIVESLLPSFKDHLPLAKDGLVPRGQKKDQATGLPIDTNEPGDDDPDGDGLPNVLERFYGSDPANPDSDGDGVTDGQEVDTGFNPTGAGRLFDFTGGRFD